MEFKSFHRFTEKNLPWALHRQRLLPIQPVTPQGTLLGCPPWSSLVADKTHPPLNAASVPHPLGLRRRAGPVGGGGHVTALFHGNSQPGDG